MVQQSTDKRYLGQEAGTKGLTSFMHMMSLPDNSHMSQRHIFLHLDI